MRYAVLAVLALCCSAPAVAQDGVSTAGAARANYLGKLGVIPSASEFVVEDFVNYHRHELPRPKVGQAVALDLRLGAEHSVHGETVLQIGMATALSNDRKQIRPLNLVLVIDKSGSMAANDKLNRVKDALMELVARLRPADTVSLVTFDSEASVDAHGHRMEDQAGLREAIQSIRPGSSTNIEGGLRLGYQEALKNFDKRSTNRVLLLTDGIANVGVTDPAKISLMSRQFNAKGVDLSTIGVGQDLDKDLLRTLAKGGHGLYHFVAEDQDIKKVFVNELQSLLSPVALTPKLTVEYGGAAQRPQVFGFDPAFSGHKVEIALDTMNTGMTEVVLMKFRNSGEADPVKVSLTYRDIERDKDVELSGKIMLGSPGRNETDLLEDPGVAKNYVIATLAQAMHDMAVQCENQKYRQAKDKLDQAINFTIENFPNLEDEDVKRNLAMATQFRELLAAHISTLGEPVEETAEGGNPQRHGSGTNLVPNGDFAAGNSGFLCEKPYIAPAPNCLWGTYYTVAEKFNQPAHLHTNVPSEPYSAPEGGKVLFMNSGGGERLLVWSGGVQCKPHTKYRVSFYAIGLSGGAEWANTYEIRVGQSRSEGLLGGVMRYEHLSYEWESGENKTVSVSIVRQPSTHSGGIIGIANIRMEPVKDRVKL